MEIKITLEQIQKIIDKQRRNRLNINTISMNKKTWRYINDNVHNDITYKNYAMIMLPQTIFGLNVHINDNLKDNEVYVYDSNNIVTYKQVKKAMKDKIKYEDELWQDIYKKRLQQYMFSDFRGDNNKFVTRKMNLSFTTNKGEIRLEPLERSIDFIDSHRIIVPTIRLNGFILTDNSVFEIENLDKHVLRNVMIKLKEFEEELKKLI